MLDDSIILQEAIESKIYLIRGKKVMLDMDLSLLYDVTTKRLKEQVKRNTDRFPPDFMFELTKQEVTNLRSHFATSRWGGLRYMPFAFTEQGVAMLSSILNSKRAIHVNIQIMRTFTKLREMLLTNEMLRLKIEDMEKRYDHQFKIVFDAIKKILVEPVPPKRRIGFGVNDD